MLGRMMEHLHAYWRMEYVEAPKLPGEDGNPFTKIPEHPDERAVLLIWRGERTYLVMNRYPYNAGHLLAIPYRAVPDISDLDDAESAELMQTVKRGKEILQKALNPDGYNIGMNLGSSGGAGIPEHLHFHIVPRWKGDTNFMPVIGKTRVLPESLDRMWERLREFA